MQVISAEKVCFIIYKAREFDVKVDPVEPDPGSDPADDQEREILEDYEDDATEEELRGAIESLNEGEQIELIALTLVGRGDFALEEWQDAVAEARGIVAVRPIDWLIDIPLLSDFLEEGLSAFGQSCRDFELNRL